VRIEAVLPEGNINFNILLTDIACGYPQAQEDDNQKYLEGINHQGCHNAIADAWRSHEWLYEWSVVKAMLSVHALILWLQH